MKIAYLDCHSGISGDMILGALIDLGVPLKDIEKELKKLPLKGYRIASRKVKRNGFGATQLLVETSTQKKKGKKETPPHRGYTQIRDLISGSKLSPSVKIKSLAVFEAIGKAEAKVHRMRLEKIHFHEVGAVDSIVDIVGGVVAFELLGAGKILASELNTGEGTVECEHGVLPVPAPATLELLRGIPCYSSGIRTELTTPTGAALIGHFASAFGPLPPMKIDRTGCGAGSKMIKDLPNMLRIITGEVQDEGPGKICVIETNIDDMNPEFFEPVMHDLLRRGALDVFWTATGMKKNRPGIQLTVLAPPHKKEVLARIILTETSSFGLRWWEAERDLLDREWITVTIEGQVVKVKIGRLEGEIVQVSPEYEDCRKLAGKIKQPIREVYRKAQEMARKALRGRER